MNKSLFIYLLLSTGICAAESMKTFSLNQSECILKEHGSAKNKNALTFKGDISGVDSMQFCEIAIPTATYEKHFKFCYLSGISVYGPGSCSLRKLGKKYSFETSPAGQADCTYTCITN